MPRPTWWSLMTWRRALLALAVLGILVLCCSCDERTARAQAGADLVAGIKSARVALEAGYATQEVLNILTGVEKYVPAATGVNPSEWPAPRMTAEQIVHQPERYAESAPPVPDTIMQAVMPYLEGALKIGLGLLLGGSAGTVVVRRGYQAALQIACHLADANELEAKKVAAESGNQQVIDHTADLLNLNKRAAKAQQTLMKVDRLTAKVRGKAVAA